ncbi:MAG TPA: class I SAM-dependent methyltransferase, partial [Candidatus Polarisedimenticolaceae bacterium]|nr:class I SAM-dependent methyltransferase [Candidatus Polarisedimenticolaceae bacterium]
ALDVAPGLARPRIGAEDWRAHDGALWSRLREEAQDRRDAARTRAPRLAGSDAAEPALLAARRNVERAGVARAVRLELRDLREVEAPWSDPGVLVTNPPYGERLGEPAALAALYAALGDLLRRRFPGWTGWVLCGNPMLAKQIGLRPAARHVLYNGPIECRLLELPISARPVSSSAGPGWRRPSAAAAGFARRVKANERRLARWAATEGLSCYRVYDADVPEYNLSVDRYGTAVRVEEHARPRKIAPELAAARLRDALAALPAALGVDPAELVLAGSHGGARRELLEDGLRFRVDLADPLDTGLPIDERLLRRRIRQRSSGREFLGLFGGCGAAAVAAAAGGARSTTSVDSSAAHLARGREQLALNGFAGAGHRLVHADPAAWLRASRGRFGLVLVVLPSPRLSADALVSAVAPRLAPGGEILLAVRAGRDAPPPPDGWSWEDCSAELTPEDCSRRPRLRVWAVSPSG